MIDGEDGADEFVTLRPTEGAKVSSFAITKAAGVDFDYDEREARAREFLRLVSSHVARGTVLHELRSATSADGEVAA